MGYLDVDVKKILREFEKSFQFENWKIYPSSKMGASLIEDETKNFFYLITGSDSDYPILSIAVEFLRLGE